MRAAAWSGRDASQADGVGAVDDPQGPGCIERHVATVRGVHALGGATLSTPSWGGMDIGVVAFPTERGEA